MSFRPDATAASHMPTRVDALLCYLPFGLLWRPSLALGLLQAAGQRTGARIESRYFSITLASIIGSEAYDTVASDLLRYGIHEVGQWLFASALFPGADLRPEEYLETVLRATAMPYRPIPFSDGQIATLLGIKDHVEPFLERCTDEALARQPKLVGFSCGPQQRVPSLALARRIKRAAPGTCVVFGGCDCERVMGAEIVRRFPFVDAVVSGLGDVAFPELLTRVVDGDPITGIEGVYTQETDLASLAESGFPSAAREPDIDDLPYPTYDDYYAQLESLGCGPAPALCVPVETARGCWWADRGSKCTFCSENPGALPFRSKSTERAVAELTHLAARHRPALINITDRNLDLAYFDGVVPSLARYPLPAQLFVTARATMTKDQIRALAAAGMVHACIGLESLISPVLKLMRKGTSALHNLQILKWARELGVQVYWNMLWGFPGEPADEYRRLARLVPRLTHLAPPSIETPFALMRFSPLFNDAEELGLVDVSPAPAYSYLYPFGPTARANLATYFTYDYRVPRDAESYTRDLGVAIDEWRQVHHQSELCLVDDDDGLLVWDRRPGSPQRVLRLRGLERRLVLACDGRQKLAKLHAMASEDLGRTPSLADVESALEALERRWLLIHEKDRWLGLGVLVSDTPRRERVRSAALQLLETTEALR